MNKKIKIVGAALLAAAMCAAFSGCANNEKPKDELTESNIESHIESIFGGNSSAPSSSETPQLEQIDPFEGLSVVFDGISPKSSVTVKGGSSYVTYKTSVEKGVKNGDAVTITAELKGSYANKYELTADKKDYTVEGLASYAAKLDEIPGDVLQKMDSTAQDNYAAYMAKSISKGKLNSMELLGNYMLCPKDASAYGTDANRVYCVYRMDADISGYNTSTEPYYWCAYFKDVTILPDGTVSVEYGSYAQGNVNSMELAAFVYLYGSNDLDTIFSKNVTANIDKYSYESTVKDVQ